MVMCEDPHQQPARGRPGRRHGRDEHGQALVEFILIVPFLFALLAGIFETVFYATTRDAVASAVRQAARVAASEGAITPDVSSALDQALRSGNSAPQDLVSASGSVGGVSEQATVSSQGAAFPLRPLCALVGNQTTGSQFMTVSVTYQYHLVFPFLGSPLFLDLGHLFTSSPIHESVTVPSETAWRPDANGPVLENGTATTCTPEG
jgi:Flp pilus assembly protein TadG